MRISFGRKKYDIVLSEIPSSYLEVQNNKDVPRRHKRNYDVIYISRGGKIKKVKIPHETDPIEDNESAGFSHILDEANKKKPTDKKAKKAQEKAALIARKADLKLKASRWKRCRGDRIEGRRIQSLNGMSRLMSYIMADRNDALNTFADNFDITQADVYCREKIKQGNKSFSMLYVLLAAYVRVVSQRPGLNRFIAGQEVYSRHTIDVVMTVKKTLAIDAPDTCVKVVFEPTDTIDDVYRKFNTVVENSIGENADTGFDSFVNIFKKLPRWVLRLFVWVIKKLDYHGKVPLSLLEISPFHGSMIITSMGSLGIKPIYHHIYNFGTLPIFVAYGKKRAVTTYTADGEFSRRKVMDVKVVTDERICDGYYFASAFKMMKKYVENPELLETPPEEVFYDVD